MNYNRNISIATTANEQHIELTSNHASHTVTQGTKSLRTSDGDVEQTPFLVDFVWTLRTIKGKRAVFARRHKDDGPFESLGSVNS